MKSGNDECQPEVFERTIDGSYLRLLHSRKERQRRAGGFIMQYKHAINNSQILRLTLDKRINRIHA